MSKHKEIKKEKKKLDKIDFLFISIGLILAAIACIPGKVY